MFKTKIRKFLPHFTFILSLIITVELGLLPNDDPQEKPAQTALAEPSVLGANTAARGEEKQKTKPGITKISEPNLDHITAESFLVFDLKTGQTLVEKNPKSQVKIASLTKLMTALVAYRQSDLNGLLKITPKDLINVAPVLGLRVGDEIKALDIFNAMLVGSSNDAALALANYTASSVKENFIALMNQESTKLGMVSTHFSNPFGFDSQYNYSTSEDLKILITETEKLSVFTNLGRRAVYEFDGKEKHYYTNATNKLLAKHPDILSIKTGYTPYSGGAMATKIVIGDYEIVTIILASQNRELDTIRLKEVINSSFRFE